jgi:protein SCO1/2
MTLFAARRETRDEWKRSRMQRLLSVVFSLAFAAVSLSLAGCGPRSPHEAPADIGGPFHLVDQTGAKVDESILRGKWSAVFFGYTYCPDVCPTTLTALGHTAAALGDRSRNLQVIFVTVDPERDTPAVLASYLASPSFPRGVRGLTGSPSQVAAIAKAYHVYYQKVAQGTTYSMDHSAVIYLMDPNGVFAKPLDPTATPAEMARQISGAMAAG